MPFDTTQTSVVERLGIIPVPDDVLQQHKRDVVANYQATDNRFPKARWYEFYQYGSRYFSSNDDDYGPTGHKMHPIGAVEYLLKSQSPRSSNVTTPSEVMYVVEIAERRARVAGIETERVAGFFYTDPYVSLVYHENGVVKKACLAIWDGQVVLHLAKLI